MRKILAIESSCDETACAIVSEDLNVLSSVVSSQIDVHSSFGGVVPEIASRMHVEAISLVIKQALKEANLEVSDVDAIAYTIGPGLIGCLHIGGIAAKSLAYFYNKPLIGVHHLKGHIFINELIEELKYPLLSLVVSGGHTELVYVKDDMHFEIIGTTHDDAIGESYDKVARLMDLQYPGGPKIDKLAKEGKPHYTLTSPKVDNYDFSFSGLKSSCLQLKQRLDRNNEELVIEDLAYAFQETALKQLINKTKLAIENYDVKQFILAGGVAANSRLRELVQEEIKIPYILPPLKYCTDNATMIALAGFHNLRNNKFADYDSESKASLAIDSSNY